MGSFIDYQTVHPMGLIDDGLQSHLQRVDPFVWVVCDGLNLFSYNVTNINKQNKKTQQIYIVGIFMLANS